MLMLNSRYSRGVSILVIACQSAELGLESGTSMLWTIGKVRTLSSKIDFSAIVLSNRVVTLWRLHKFEG